MGFGRRKRWLLFSCVGTCRRRDLISHRTGGEKLIVNLIREIRMGVDAKIDLEKVRSSYICSGHVH